MHLPVRPGGTPAAIRLAAARVARRRGPAGLVALSVAATVAVLGALFGVASEAADAAIHEALATRPAADRSVVIERFTEVALREGESDARARGLLGGLAGVSEPVSTMAWFPPAFAPNLVVAVDDVAHWATLVDGRFPKPCAGGPSCEAVLVNRPFRFADLPPPTSSSLGDIRLDVVGTVELTDAFPVDLPSSQGDPVMIDGTRIADGSAIDGLPRTRFWVSTLDPDRLHAWDMAAVQATIDSVQREIALSDAAMTLEAPTRTFSQVADRVAIADSRIVFVGSLVVAVLFAFAFFAAAIDRDDLRGEYRRLVAGGARRRHLLALVLTEALLPSIVGTALGWLLALGIVLGLARVQGVTAPLDLVRGSLLNGDAMAFILGAGLVLALAVAIGLHPASGRFLGGRTIALAALPVVGVLLWDRITGGALAAGDLASGIAGPGTVLLPGMLGLTVILLSLAILPPLFRRLATRSGRFPLSLRLAVLSIAREPLRPVATLTLLGFSFGAALFGMSYGATLRQGAIDAADYATGLDVRIEPADDSGSFARRVLNPIRNGAAGPDITVAPLIRIPAQTSNSIPVSLVGLDAGVIPQLRGWRSDFSDASQAQVRDAIAQPGTWQLPGHPIEAGARTISVTATANVRSEPIEQSLVLRAVVDTADGDYRIVQLGSVQNGTHTYSGPLLTPAEVQTEPPGQPAGWRLVALVVSLPDLENSFGPAVTITGTLAFAGLPELADPARPVDIEVSISHDRQAIRGHVPTDGLVLPAIVPPDLMDQVDSAGQLSIELPDGLVLHLRPAVQARFFPTMTDPTREGIVVDEAPLLLAINAFDPGQGIPNEALLATPDDTATARAVAALGTDPFPKLVLVSRPALEARATSDPFAVGLSATLLVGAIAGLVLALAGMLLAAVAELRDERGELADLEEQGLRPASLRRLTTVRALLLVVLALLAGTGLGLALTWFTTLALAVGLTEAEPIPPLAVVVPWVAVAVLAAGLVVAVAVGTLLLAIRRFGGRRLLRQAEG